jgi:TolB protein
VATSWVFISGLNTRGIDELISPREIRHLMLLLLVLAAAFPVPASAQDEVTIGTTRHGISLVDMALPKFLNPSADPALAATIEELREVIWSDLDFSGLFQLVDRRFYGYIPPFSVQRPVYEDWEGIGAQAFLLGSMRTAGTEQGGRTIYSVDMVLYDVKSRQRMLGKKYDSSRPLLLAHTIADEIIRHYTGTAGIGTSKIAFISDRDGNKELYVMDWDGRRQVRLTANRSLDLSPSWDPDGKRIAYVSYKRGSPEIFVMDAYAGREVVFAGGRGASFFSPEWTPDGQSVVFNSSLDGESELYIRAGEGKEMRRLTFSRGIDTSPSFSPDGRRLAFNSSRTGSPQIYIMDADGLNAERISFGEMLGRYNSCPAWSPDGSRVAFCSRKNGFFHMFTIDVAEGRIRRLTSGQSNNEEPSWSPDGRHIAFTSDRGGTKQIFIMNADGARQRAVTSTGNNSSPSWAGR